MNNANTALSYKEILKSIEDPLKKVEDILIKNLVSDIPLLTEVSQYILQAGGKRFRPALLLLASGTVGDISEKACVAGAVIEYIHTATLLHDDVVDNADLRRSKKAARSIWGNEASVLVGDYLFTVSFQFLAELEDLDLIRILSKATTTMAKGEIIQLERNNAEATEKEYLQIIEYKTASLIGTAMSLGAKIAGGSKENQNALYHSGINIGMAFQMVDDALDYDVENVKIGKEPGTDLKERKITLPLSHLIEKSEPEDRQNVLKILAEDVIDDNHVQTVCQLMNKYKSIQYTLDRAKEYSEKAITCIANLPNNEYKLGIELLSKFIISRKV